MQDAPTELAEDTGNQPFQRQYINLPPVVIWGTVIISVLPLLLTFLGVDFGNHSLQLDSKKLATLHGDTLTETIFQAMSGALTHALLEWTAFSIAVVTVVLGFVHYRLAQDMAIPVICIALLFSGVMDAFHTLAAGRLITSNADNSNLIPFTWAVARMFNALIMLAGVAFFMIRGARNRKMPVSALFICILVTGGIAYGLIAYMATSAELPQTQYPDSIVTRPYDVVPLLLYAFGLLYLYPMFYRVKPSPFAHALILTAFVEVMVEFHMAFGSHSLFDSHFNIAHFLKIVGYAVPLFGLMLDYIDTYQQQEEYKYRLERQTVDLMHTNQELNEFAYIASHDLKEPLRGINNYSVFLKEDYYEQFDDEGKKMLDSLQRLTKRLQCLIDDLLEYSRVSQAKIEAENCDIQLVVAQSLELIESRLKENDIEIRIPDPLPSIVCDKSRVQDIFLNLVTNAMKYNDKQDKWIEIGVNRDPNHKPQFIRDNETVFYVKDNGIGIKKKHLENIFRIFKRLHAQGKYGGGTGAGLTIVKKILEKQGGNIWVDSEEGKGTTFYFTFGEQAKG